MSLRKPRLSCGLPSSTFALLRDALSQFHVRLEEGDEGRELKSLKMDDLDFVEALELIECVIGAEIPKPSLHASITIDQVVDCIEKARRVEVRSAQPHQGPNNG